MLNEPDVRGPLAALPWMAMLRSGALLACAICHRSTVYRLPGRGLGGQDLGLHPDPCLVKALDTGLLTEGEPEPARPAPTALKGAYARRARVA